MGCSSHAPVPGPETSSAPAPYPDPAATGLVKQDGRPAALTAHGMIDALEGAGFAVPNPLDTTSQECRATGCAQSIVTDTLRIVSFPTIAQAEHFAESRDLHRTESFVVSFAPPLTEAERVRYRLEIARLAK